MSINNQKKIIIFLMGNKEELFSINQIAKSLNMNYKIAFQETKKLEKEGIIKISRLGNSNQCSFSYQLNEKTFSAELIKRAEFLRNKDFKVFYNRVTELKNPFFTLLVFGSHANGKAKKASDLDVCLITESQEVKKNIQTIVSITPFEVHIIEFTSREFQSMINTKKSNVGKEILDNNIILKGIEPFYEMIANA